MTEYQKKDIAEILDNLTYWETCPQAYKDRIPKLIEALKQGQTLPIDSVVGQSEQLKAEQEAYNAGYNEGANEAATEILSK